MVLDVDDRGTACQLLVFGDHGVDAYGAWTPDILPREEGEEVPRPGEAHHRVQVVVFCARADREGGQIQVRLCGNLAFLVTLMLPKCEIWRAVINEFPKDVC